MKALFRPCISPPGLSADVAMSGGSHRVSVSGTVGSIAVAVGSGIAVTVVAVGMGVSVGKGGVGVSIPNREHPAPKEAAAISKTTAIPNTLTRCR